MTSYFNETLFEQFPFGNLRVLNISRIKSPETKTEFGKKTILFQDYKIPVEK